MKRFALLVAIFAAAPCWAAYPGAEALDARAVGMGGALRSLAGAPSAARYNPAALGPVRGFFGEASYATQAQGGFDGIQVTIVDNITSPMGGALQYVHLNGHQEREEISLSLAAGGRGLWWGFTTRYVHARERGDAEWDELFTGDVGFLFERPGGLRIAAVGYDLLDTTSPYLNRRVALSVSKVWDRGLATAFDVVRNLDDDFSSGFDFHVGVEYRLPDSPWVFRAGQFWEGSSAMDFASLGVGWSFGTSVELGYAVRKARQNSSEYLHVFTVEGSF